MRNLNPAKLTGQVGRFALTFGSWLMLVLSLGTTLAQAEMPAEEQAATWNADDANLRWGPCPTFLPKECGIAVLHGDPAKDNLDIFLKVPAKSALPLHWHTSAKRMILVAGELHVTYDGQQKSVLKPGTYAKRPCKAHASWVMRKRYALHFVHRVRVAVGRCAGRER